MVLKVSLNMKDHDLVASSWIDYIDQVCCPTECLSNLVFVYLPTYIYQRQHTYLPILTYLLPVSTSQHVQTYVNLPSSTYISLSIDI